MRCAFCPHTQDRHYYSEAQIQVFCTDCMEPCSYYFIPVHEFRTDSRNPGWCGRCKLSPASDAHNPSARAD